MKLDFESNTQVVSSIDEEFYNDTSFEKSSTEVLPMLRAGIKAAQEGNRAEAKVLLLRVTEIEPGNEEAWMRLASVSEYPEELLGFLNHVLDINPHNERASEWANSTRTLLAKTFVERGMNASKDAHKDFARQCFLQATALDGENETAWLWLASVSDSAEEKTARLEKVLSLNPENENAIVLLKSVKNQKINALLEKAAAAAVADEQDAAKQMLEEILSDAPELVEAWVLKSFLVSSFEEKIDCFEKILDLDDENELANVNWTALLDLMSKSESQARVAEAKSFFALDENNFADSETSLASPEMNKSSEHNTFSLVKPSETVQSDFNAQADEEEFYDNNESVEAAYFYKEDEKNFAVGEADAADEENEVFEVAAQTHTEYSESQSEYSEEVSEDFSQYVSGEISLPQDVLPSYYENEENLTEPLEAAENDYSEEFKKDEPEFFAENNLKSEQTSVSDEEEFDEENSAEANFAETAFTDENFNESSNQVFACPFCSAEEETQPFVCGSCRTMLTLSDLEMLLAHGESDREILRQAVERMEDERNRRDFGAEDFKLLAIGQINLKNLRQGCVYLQEASQLNPNDVVLSSQLNSLKIRLAEIEEQQSIHESMPRNRKILVVDDSATVRKLITGKLEKSGHEVFCAVDGLDAMEKIAEIVPDLILLDINMPRMDGYQVCKLIRGNETTKDVPVVMISGKDGFFDKVRGRMAGTTGYITKPFGPETLMKMVETYIVQNG